MRRLTSPERVERLIEETVARFGLDLDGIAVLTETASGPFVVTPLIAACAGATVVAVTRDSRYGSADEVRAYTEEWAGRLGVSAAVEVYVGVGADRAGAAELVTNLGFVRPIDAAFVERLRPGAAVSLMCEPWEVRPEDVDVIACRAAAVPVAGTNEHDPRLQTFRFVGMLALKLLLDLEVEVFLSKVVLVSSEPFTTPIAEVLEAAGSDVVVVDVASVGDLHAPDVIAACTGVDALVVAEHRDRRTIVGGDTGIPIEALAAAGTTVAHIAGAIEDPQGRLEKNPPGPVAPGWMTVTTDALGPRPVIDLHAAGLRVGQALVKGIRTLDDASGAERAALDESPALVVAL
jgi:hypothetical protein